MAQPGNHVSTIDTPALVIDLDAMERNLARMAAFARAAGVRLRPHAKMHKSAEIARWQVAAGAVGVCVQKTAEAEALAAAGVDDLYLSNEVVAPGKLARVAALARTLAARGGRLAIAVDGATGVERLAEAVRAARAEIDVFVEIDVGQARCGVLPADRDATAAVELAADESRRTRGSGWRGSRPTTERRSTSGASRRGTPWSRRQSPRRGPRAMRSLAAGLPCPLVTGAGTGTYAFESASGVYGELQTGELPGDGPRLCGERGQCSPAALRARSVL